MLSYNCMHGVRGICSACATTFAHAVSARSVDLHVVCRQAEQLNEEKRVLEDRVAALWKERASMMQQMKVAIHSCLQCHNTCQVAAMPPSCTHLLWHRSLGRGQHKMSQMARMRLLIAADPG